MEEKWKDQKALRTCLQQFNHIVDAKAPFADILVCASHIRDSVSLDEHGGTYPYLLAHVAGANAASYGERSETMADLCNALKAELRNLTLVGFLGRHFGDAVRARKFCVRLHDQLTRGETDEMAQQMT